MCYTMPIRLNITGNKVNASLSRSRANFVLEDSKAEARKLLTTKAMSFFVVKEC